MSGEFLSHAPGTAITFKDQSPSRESGATAELLEEVEEVEMAIQDQHQNELEGRGGREMEEKEVEGEKGRETEGRREIGKEGKREREALTKESSFTV